MNGRDWFRHNIFWIMGGAVAVIVCGYYLPRLFLVRGAIGY